MDNYPTLPRSSELNRESAFRLQNPLQKQLSAIRARQARSSRTGVSLQLIPRDCGGRMGRRPACGHRAAVGRAAADEGAGEEVAKAWLARRLQQCYAARAQHHDQKQSGREAADMRPERHPRPAGGRPSGRLPAAS